jgi:hypothetical protein
LLVLVAAVRLARTVLAAAVQGDYLLVSQVWFRVQQYQLLSVREERRILAATTLHMGLELQQLAEGVAV